MVARASSSARWRWSVVEPEPAGERAQPAVRHLVGQQPAGQRGGVDQRMGEPRPAVTLQCRVQEAGVEPDVVAYEHRALSELDERGSTASTRGAGPTIDAVMPVSSVISGGMARPGFTSVWNVPSTSPAHLHRAELGDGVALGRRPCGLEVDHAERHVRQWCAEIVEAALHEPNPTGEHMFDARGFATSAVNRLRGATPSMEPWLPPAIAARRAAT